MGRDPCRRMHLRRKYPRLAGTDRTPKCHGWSAVGLAPGSRRVAPSLHQVCTGFAPCSTEFAQGLHRVSTGLHPVASGCTGLALPGRLLPSGGAPWPWPLLRATARGPQKGLTTQPCFGQDPRFHGPWLHGQLQLGPEQTPGACQQHYPAFLLYHVTKSWVRPRRTLLVPAFGVHVQTQGHGLDLLHDSTCQVALESPGLGRSCASAACPSSSSAAMLSCCLLACLLACLHPSLLAKA